MIIMVELMIAKKTKHTADERKIVPVGARKEERMHTYRSSNRTERVTAYYSCHDAIICMHHVSADSYDCRMSLQSKIHHHLWLFLLFPTLSTP